MAFRILRHCSRQARRWRMVPLGGSTMSLHSCHARSRVSCARKCATSDLSTGGESHCLPANRASRQRYAHRLTTCARNSPNPRPPPDSRWERRSAASATSCRANSRRYFQGRHRSPCPQRPARDSRALLVALSRELQVRARPTHTSCRTRPIHGSVLFASQSESSMNWCADLAQLLDPPSFKCAKTLSE